MYLSEMSHLCYHWTAVSCMCVSRCVVDALQEACHLYDESLAKLTVLTDATNQKISLTKHLARECNVEVLIIYLIAF